jgi:hypothetical protein
LNFGGSGPVAVAGTLSGVAIALGGTWMVLAYGQGLGTGLLCTLVIVALVMGAGVSLVAAFFGLVMPRHMHGPWLDPAHWERLREHRRRWHEARCRRWGAEPGGFDGPGDAEEEEEGGPASRRRRTRRG